MNCEKIKILKQGRKNIIKRIDKLTIKELNTILDNYNNNILWQLAHLLVTTDLLFYKLSGLKTKYPNSFIDTFKKGTKPTRAYTELEYNEWKSDFFTQIDEVVTDIEANKFVNYTEYPNSYGITLRSFDDALYFNCVHEALHYGDINSICKNL